jgi:ABC-2 type transport system permease protein
MSGLFPNAWHVARREYLQRVRSRSFMIVTAVLAIAGLAIGLLPVIGRLIEGDATTQIGVYAPQGELRAEYTTAIGLILSATDGSTDGQAEPYDVQAIDDDNDGRARVRSGELDGLLIVESGETDVGWELYTDASFTSSWLVAVRQAATQVTIADRLERAGVDPGEAGEIFAPTAFEVTPTDPQAAGDEPDFGPDYVLSNALVILTFMAVVTYGSWVATSVAEEKSSRVMELLITAAHPRQLLAGKVLGNGGAGLTQYVVVLASVLVAVLLQGFIAERLFGSGGAELDQLDLVVMIPFALLFVPGFMLYCILYAGLGSLASRQEDVTQVTGPMLFLGMGGYFVAFVAMATPDLAWIKVLSLIPFFSPYLLPTRFLLGTPPAAWEWLAAGALMLLFLLGALWVASRIYSAGVLLYGQRLSFRNAWNAVRVNR